MGKVSLGFIAFTAEQASVALSVGAELGEHVSQPLTIEMAEAAKPESVSRAGRHLESKCQAVVTSAGIATELRDQLSIPVVHYGLSRADLLEALYRASQKGRKVAVFLHPLQDCDLGVWPGVLGIEVRRVTLESRGQAQQAVAQSKAQGVEVVVGGSMVGKFARDMGLRHELISIGKESIRQAMEKAVDIVRAVNRERENNLRFQALVDAADQGVIFVDEEGRAAYANDLACRILRLSRHTLVGKSLLSALGNVLTPEAQHELAGGIVGEDPRPLKGTLLRFRDGGGIVATTTPVVTDGIRLGALLGFTEVSRLQRVEARVRRQLAEAGLVARYRLEDILGQSAAILEARLRAKAYATTDSAVLICGETGTGKELFAHAIHSLSARVAGPFVAINCSALPKELMESELFGYEEGAFTGTRKGGKQGLFELAHGGTVFLDEIGTMPFDSQARLLRVIQEKEVIRVGGTRMIPVDVRVIAATNCDLAKKVRSGEFREDLFYRLNVLVLEVPPLRERREDVPLLFVHFLSRAAPDIYHRVMPLGEAITGLLEEHDWPGNVRELENLVHRFVALARHHPDDCRMLLEGLLKDALPSGNQPACPPTDGVRAGPDRLRGTPREPVPYRDAIQQAERELLYSIGEQVNWNRKEMAGKLGISCTTLWRKLKNAGISDFRLAPVAHPPSDTR